MNLWFTPAILVSLCTAEILRPLCSGQEALRPTDAGVRGQGPEAAVCQAAPGLPHRNRVGEEH